MELWRSEEMQLIQVRPIAHVSASLTEVTCSVLILGRAFAAHHPRRRRTCHCCGAWGSGAAAVQGPQPGS